MNRKNFGGTSGVIIDVCTLHGSFFDPGELPRVLEFARRGGLAKARAAQDAQRPERPSMARVVPDAGGPSTMAGLDLTDLFDFVVDVLTTKK